MGFEIFTKIDENDNVAIANVAIMKGDVIPLSDKTITAKAEIPEGTIFALDDIRKGGYIIKYGFKAGVATADIEHGDSLSTYNYTTELEDIETLCAILSQTHKAYIAQKAESLRDYSLRFSAYNANGSIGLFKAVVVISSKEYAEQAKALDEGAFIVESVEEAKTLLKHPNLACALVLGYEIENSENIISLTDPANAKDGLERLRERANEFKKASFPLSDLTVELYGATVDPSYNHMIGSLVDDLICLGANVIVDITKPIGKAVYLIKEKLIDRSAERYIPSLSREVDDDTELNFIQLLGKSEIATIITKDNELKAGLNLCFEPKYANSQIILDLTGKKKETALSPVLDMSCLKKGQELTVESLLFDINRIISNNR